MSNWGNKLWFILSLRWISSSFVKFDSVTPHPQAFLHFSLSQKAIKFILAEFPSPVCYTFNTLGGVDDEPSTG